jgi:signal transduction histidine kinase
MVSDILDYSRMTTYGIELEVTEFDMSDLIQDLTTKYQVLVKDSKISVGYESADQIRVKGDRIRLEQAIENLMRNAINYSPDGGEVKVLVKYKEDKVRIEVRDQGVGIPEEELPMIWERYYRTKGIKKRKIYGSGLGLSIVKSILEAHKAMYGADSVPGEGTTFWFELTIENL